MGGTIYSRKTIVSRVTHLYRQHRLETHEYPKETVVFEAFCHDKSRTPAGWPTVKELLQSPTYRLLTASWSGSRFDETFDDGAGLIAPEIGEYNQRLAGHNFLPPFDAGLLFVGERRSLGGTRRIVLAAPELWYDPRQVWIEWLAVVPATLIDQELIESETNFSRIKSARVKIPFTGGFRAFGGQRNPNDSSRFTVDYETATEKGTIVGVLQDDGSVAFSIIKR